MTESRDVHDSLTPRIAPFVDIMLEFNTQGYNGCAVKYSPFFDSRLAVAASANFGLVGNGRFYFLELTPQGIRPVKW